MSSKSLEQLEYDQEQEDMLVDAFQNKLLNKETTKSVEVKIKIWKDFNSKLLLEDGFTKLECPKFCNPHGAQFFYNCSRILMWEQTSETNETVQIAWNSFIAEVKNGQYQWRNSKIIVREDEWWNYQVLTPYKRAHIIIV